MATDTSSGPPVSVILTEATKVTRSIVQYEPEATGKATDEVPNEVLEATKEVTNDVPETTKETPYEAPEATNEVTKEPPKEVPEATNEVTKEVPEATNEAPNEVPEGTKEVTKEVPDNTLVSKTEALTLADNPASNLEQTGPINDEYEQDLKDKAAEPVEKTEPGLDSHDQRLNDKLNLGTVLASEPVDSSDKHLNADLNGAVAVPKDSSAVDHSDVPETSAVAEQNTVNGEPTERPDLSREPSRSYINKPIPIVTTYEHETPETKVRSTAPSVRAASVRAPSVNPARSTKDLDLVVVDGADTRPASRAEARPASRASARPVDRTTSRPASRAASRADTTRAATVTDAGVVYAAALPGSKAGSVRSPSIKEGSIREKSARPGSVRASSRAGSIRDSVDRRQYYTNGPSAAVGDVVSIERQRQLQQGGQDPNAYGRPPYDQSSNERSLSPRPASAFGYRPLPNLVAVVEDGRESRYDESRAGGPNRGNTVLSRANTLGRNGTLTRAANGGTVGSRRGAFGRGAGASVGTQPEEVLGRDDIHTRAELSERILDEATLRRLSTMEKKDAVRLAKLIKAEGKAEAQSVKASIKELERLSKLQKEAAATERKSQLRLGKWTKREHKARLRFLKEKERYEKVEGELRNAENDYEERRDHAAGLTAQVAEKTQELDDLRGQKAADDREREVKLLALKNPAHS